MANKRKITKDNEGLIRTLFATGISLRLIEKITEINSATLTKFQKEHEIEFTALKGAELQLRLLELYSSLVADQNAIGMFAGAKVDIQRLLRKELGLNHMEAWIHSTLLLLYQACNLRFDASIPEAEHKFIRDIYDRFRFRKHPELSTWQQVAEAEEFLKGLHPSKEHCNKIIDSIMMQLHHQELPFPTEDEFADRYACYESWMRPFQANAMIHIAPYVSIELRDFIRNEFDKLEFSERRLSAVEIRYSIGWGVNTVEHSREMVSKNVRKVLGQMATICEFMVLSPMQVKRIIDAKQEEIDKAKEECLEEKRNLIRYETLVDEFTKKKFNGMTFNQLLRNDSKLSESNDISQIFGILPNQYKTLITPIEDLDLSVRAYNCLKAYKCNFFFEIILAEISELKKMRNIGNKTINEIEELVIEKGFHLEYKLLSSDLLADLKSKCYTS